MIMNSSVFDSKSTELIVIRILFSRLLLMMNDILLFVTQPININYESFFRIVKTKASKRKYNDNIRLPWRRRRRVGVGNTVTRNHATMRGKPKATTTTMPTLRLNTTTLAKRMNIPRSRATIIKRNKSNALRRETRTMVDITS